MNKTIHYLAVATLFCFAMQNVVANTENELNSVQHNWAVANYQLADNEQEKAFESLISQIDELTAGQPDSPQFWIWSGIIKSSYAGTKGGLGALSLVKDARKDLEKAIDLDDQALSGSAYTSLGTLYHQVPGWPIGFGSDKKARKLLTRALSINPQGIDPNYFYGEYLYDEGEYDEALKYLRTAQGAAPRPNRQIADESRQQEIAVLLAEVEKRLNR
jgi:tetratricopeptide (TPR) repeat protein